MPTQLALNAENISLGVTPQEIIDIALANIGEPWAANGCAAFVWGVTNLAGLPFFDLENKTVNNDPRSPQDSDYIVPHSAGIGSGTADVPGDGWYLVSSSSSVADLVSVLQPGDVVRVYKAGNASEGSTDASGNAIAHSFIVVSNVGGNIQVVDNWNGAISEHALSDITNIWAPQGQFAAAFVSRIDSAWVAANVPQNTLAGDAFGDWSALTLMASFAASGYDVTLPAYGYIPLSSLFTWADSNPGATVVAFSVDDYTIGGGQLYYAPIGGYLTAQPENQLLGPFPISQLSSWFFVPGASGSVDQIAFNAIDNLGNSASAVTTVTASGTSLPDLNLSIPSVLVNSTSMGVSFSFEWWFSSLPHVNTPPPQTWTDGIYLSRDPVIDSGDTLLWTTTSSAPPGGSGGIGAGLSLPSNLPFGTYYIGVIADIFNQVAEANENNNASVGIPITVGPSNHPPVIDTAYSVVSGTINELPLVTGGAGTDSVAGGIAFTDSDPTDRPTASIDTAHQTVTYQDSASHSYSLTPAQTTALEAAFSITPELGNTNTGKIDWSYSIVDNSLDFLGQGEKVTVTTPLVIDDHNGGTVAQDVAVAINGSDDRPIALPDSGTVQKGATIATDAMHGLRANDADPDTHDILHVTAISFGTQTAAVTTGHAGTVQGAYGTLTVNSDGSYSYAANKNAAPNAHDQFSYTVDDGHGATATSFLNLTVTPPNATNPYSALVEIGVHFQSDPVVNGVPTLRMGTGVLIGPNEILTAAHLFESPPNEHLGPVTFMKVMTGSEAASGQGASFEFQTQNISTTLGNNATEVAPLSWTPDFLSFRSPQWQRSTPVMCRSSAGR